MTAMPQTSVAELNITTDAGIDQDKDRSLARLGLLLAEAVSVHAAATSLMASSPGGFTAVWFGAVGMALHDDPAEVDEDPFLSDAEPNEPIDLSQYVEGFADGLCEPKHLLGLVMAEFKEHRLQINRFDIALPLVGRHR